MERHRQELKATRHGLASDSRPDSCDRLPGENRERAQTYVMAGFALVSGALIVALAVYGMATGDHDLLSRVCNLIWPIATLTAAWGGGTSVLKALRRMRFDDSSVESPSPQRR